MLLTQLGYDYFFELAGIKVTQKPGVETTTLILCEISDCFATHILEKIAAVAGKGDLVPETEFDSTKIYRLVNR